MSAQDRKQQAGHEIRMQDQNRRDARGPAQSDTGEVEQGNDDPSSSPESGAP